MSLTEIYIHFTIIYKRYWGAASGCGYVCSAQKLVTHEIAIKMLLTQRDEDKLCDSIWQQTNNN